MGDRLNQLDKWEFPLWLCNKLSQDLALLNASLIFHGSGIRTGHNRDSLPLIHDAWCLRWMTWSLGAGIIWRFICLHVWQLMLPKLKTLVGCNSWGSPSSYSPQHLTLWSLSGLHLGLHVVRAGRSCKSFSNHALPKSQSCHILFVRINLIKLTHIYLFIF